MKKLRVTLFGTSELIMHSTKLVNPLHPLAIALKELQSKRIKTEEDYIAISNIEWEGGVYWDDRVGLYIPADNIAASLKEGAKFNKNGKAVSRFCHVLTAKAPLDIGEEQNYDSLKYDLRYRDVRSVCVSKSRVNRTRPYFERWTAQFDMFYEDDKIDIGAVVLAFENAGAYVGICELRDHGYGHFNVRIEEIE